MKYRVTLFFLFFSSLLFAQITIKISSVPQYYTPLLDTIFITGSFNNWNAADSSYRMIYQQDGSYLINITATQGSTVEYKFTRGNWNNVETQSDGSFLANRGFIYNGPATITNQIANWNDMLGWHTAIGNTTILDLDFKIPQLTRNRRVWIHFPPDYVTSNSHYPVLYMQDGQNLFDAVYAPFGEWNIDGSMDSLFNVFSPTAIVVGIDHGGNDRLNEYSPWTNASYGGGEGELYSAFIVNTLKPFIDAHFRTLSGRDYTAIMGSSMGGLISYYAAMKYQNIFSKVGVFSPSFWFSDSVYNFTSTQGHQGNMKFYFMSGQQEDVDMVPDIQTVMSTMQSHGFLQSEMTLVTKADGQHSEWFWKREFPEAFKWLFSGVTDVNKMPENNEFDDLNIRQSQKQIFIKISDENSAKLMIYDVKGSQLFNKNISGQELLNIDFLSSGFYIVILQRQSGSICKKLVIE